MSEYPGYVAVEEASRAGVVPPSMSYPGVICERCGAVVAGVQLHDVWHQGQDEIVEYLRSRSG